MVKQIPLSQGKVALVDDEDFARVNAFKWSAVRMQIGNGKAHWYAKRCIRHDGTTFSIFLHRFILGVPDGLHVDHEDGNGLNCQKANMRYASRVQNAWNTRPNKNSLSGFRGVAKSASPAGWRASIGVDGSKRIIGIFETAEQAARVFDVAARHYHGEYAWTNFQDQDAEAEDIFRRWLNGEVFRPVRRWQTNATLTDDQVREIRRRYATETILYRELAAEYGVAVATISHAVSGRTYAHITDVPPLKEDFRKLGRSGRQNTARRVLTDDQVRWARRRYARRDISMRALADELGIKVSALQAAVNGYSYRHITDVPPVVKRAMTESEAA